MGIMGSREHGRMTQQLGENPQVGSTFQERRRGAVTQNVGRHPGLRAPRVAPPPRDAAQSRPG